MNFPRKLLSAVLKLLFVNLFKKRFACSAAAGNWLFGEKNFEILNNGIFVSQFRYSESRRLRIRNELKIVDRFVIGHVGRFEYAKNHRFMIDLFSIIKKKCDNAFLLLVGEGSLKESIIQKVNDMHLEKDVLFLEFTDKVSDLLQAFDVFLFPSIYEGLGIAAIEAQAASLRVVASDSIPKETGITELIEYYSLDNNLDEWVEAILSHRHGYERNDTSELIKKAGYDIEDTCKYLMEQYLLHGA
jgi:glycosyltransferase involved in cell wall biosynthesis